MAQQTVEINETPENIKGFIRLVIGMLVYPEDLRGQAGDLAWKNIPTDMPTERHILWAIEDCFDNGITPDANQIKLRVSASPTHHIQDLSAVDKIINLVDNTWERPTTLRHYWSVLGEWFRNELFKRHDKIITDIMNDDAKPRSQRIDEATKLLMDFHPVSSNAEIKSNFEAEEDAMANYRIERELKLQGIQPYPVHFLEGLRKRLKPLKPGDTSLIMGRGGMGKSSFLRTWFHDIALNQTSRHDCLLISLETLVDDLIQRDWAASMGIPFYQISNGEIDWGIEPFASAYRAYQENKRMREEKNGSVYYVEMDVPSPANIKDAMTRMAYISQLSGRKLIIGIDLFDLVQYSMPNKTTADSMQLTYSSFKSHAKALRSHLVTVIQESASKEGEAHNSAQIKNLSQTVYRIHRKSLVSENTPNGSMEKIPARDYLGRNMADIYGHPRYIQTIGDTLSGEAQITLVKSNYSAGLVYKCQFEGAMGGLFSDYPPQKEQL